MQVAVSQADPWQAILIALFSAPLSVPYVRAHYFEVPPSIFRRLFCSALNGICKKVEVASSSKTLLAPESRIRWGRQGGVSGNASAA